MRTRLTLAASAAALAMIGTACGGPTAEPAAPATPPGPAVPAEKAAPQRTKTNPLANPNSDQRVVYARGLVSDPLPARQRKVRVDRAKIEEKAARKDFGSKLQPGRPEAALRLVTVGEPGNQTTRSAWVLTWDGSEPDIKGPAGRSAQENRELAEKLSCVFVLVIDANTGTTLDARQLCEGKE